MFTTFTALAIAGGALRLVLQWQLKRRWGISLAVPQILAGALVVLAGLPEFLKPLPFPVPLGGPVPLSCRSTCSFKPPFVRRRQGFSSPVLSGGVADCRSR